jgi:hypothetical protein
MKTSWLETFKNPGAAFRGAPFWAWNGRLDPVELRRQIRLMKTMGLGGFFMHSRVGLDTPYLAKEWFDAVRACIDEAGRHDMRAWLYDEDRWPSGAAGGLVTRHEAHRARHLTIRLLPPGTAVARTPRTVAVFVARIDGAAARDVRLVPAGESPAAGAGETILHCFVELEQPSDWFNGQTYLDTMNPAAVRAFIRTTHEAYRKQVGEFFGTRVPGIFTDEPHHGHAIAEGRGDPATIRLAWTDRLPAVFRRRHGYDLIPRLPEVVFDVDGAAVSQARYRYHDCLTFLFVDSFARQVGAWCERHRLLFTGHVLEEDTLESQTRMVGSCMRFYEHMQAPGMDMLTENWRAFVTAKQVSSAARQFGRQWRLTETYGCTGWDFPFAGHKALGDWQVACGINLRCQHLSWYTMLGEAKRDYPAAIFYQSPWWNLYGKVENYFARVHAVMTRGEEVRDLLVIHPVESVWTLTRRPSARNHDAAAIDLDFLRTSDALLGAHLDFDYGDEELLARHARVSRKGGQALLRVGRAVYKAVLVPSQITMRRTTLELLRRFRAAGGSVVFAGRQAACLDAEPSGEVAAFAAGGVAVAAPDAAMIRALEPAVRRVSIADAEGREIAPALYLLREDRENFHLFVCNTGEDFAAADKKDAFGRFNALARDRRLAFPDVRIRGFAGAGRPIELDPETGAVRAAAAEPCAAGWTIRTSLPPLGSRLYLIPKAPGKGPAAAPAPPALRTIRREPLDTGAWTCRLSEANVLVLDRCAYRIGAEEWRPPAEILRVDSAVRAALGLRERGGAMVQPWARPLPAKPRTTPLALEYAFTVEQIPSGDLFLALECPESFAIRLNETPVANEPDSGWWTDRSLRKLRLDPVTLRPGRNILRLETTYAETFPGLEIVYLLGNFGARVDGTDVVMTAPPPTLSPGDWCGQGLPFYAGHVAYTRPLAMAAPAAGERVFVCVPEYRGVGVRVLIDGRSAGLIGWEPNEVEITSLLDGKPAELAIEVLGHRRNSHGPFHINTKWPAWTGPGEFRCAPDRWFDGYQLVPCGLMQPPRIEVRRA